MRNILLPCCIMTSLLATRLVCSFQSAKLPRCHFVSSLSPGSWPVLFSKRGSSEEEDEEDCSKQPSGIPQLPAFGSSSINSRFGISLNAERPSKDNDGNSEAAFLTRKFKLQYTCNICETRNSHMVSRLAYREGVVVAICKGCKNKHLIADNLNSIPGSGSGYNIEEYFKAQGMGVTVNRVTPEVFNLESILCFDTASGALVGDDGKPVLE